MSRLFDDFADRHPDDAFEHHGCPVVSFELAIELIDEAEQLGIRVLGMDGFLIGPAGTHQPLDRIADFSELGDVARSASAARALLGGAWAHPPEWGSGRYMVEVVLSVGYVPPDEQPSPCPVCGVGADQSTEPERMREAVCYCGHPRYYDYKVNNPEYPDYPRRA